MGKVYQAFGELIGNTPLLRLQNIEREKGLKAVVLAKLEYFNPAGSIKDRVAYAMITDAEEKGILKEDSVIIEPTSGNTGVGLAAYAASRGYHTIIVMPDTMSIERRKLIQAYGAELVLTEGAKGMKGAVERAEALKAEIPNSFIPGQFENPANPEMHYKTTGPELWEDTKGAIDILVAGIGTGGTISGAGKYLKEKKSSIQIIGVEPAGSPLISKGYSGSHKIQGLGANFIPNNLNRDIYNEIISIENEDAFKMGRIAAQKEGILVGISSGAALYAAIQVAERKENQGKTIAAILPDTGDRYLSTQMFRDLENW